MFKESLSVILLINSTPVSPAGTRENKVCFLWHPVIILKRISRKRNLAMRTIRSKQFLFIISL
jgi:hypothetical protein